jgi:NifU-like protein involved in Fe-S cluster formation
LSNRIGVLSVYSSKILELSTNIKNIGAKINIDDVNYTKSTKISKICGSEITIELIVNPLEKTIKEFSIDPKACALGQASAAILSQNIIGANYEEIISARDGLKAMLKENGLLPGGRFWELRYLEPISDYPSRHASTLLAWEAAVAAISQISAID